ncbi:hypothetical protein F4821DRAFT_135730 [Hypoxylon rubiginosum]|uniref:Uncharacterized protein n=1 Tax=Hypoxylon rubiginosum TaxID=110542 RepID=A0ACC0DI44_9PEZI|nr:hypothetical protein F4821DRAFT_135730 [Hypoxylon rubiginosum]
MLRPRNPRGAFALRLFPLTVGPIVGSICGPKLGRRTGRTTAAISEPNLRPCLASICSLELLIFPRERGRFRLVTLQVSRP